LAQNLHQPFGLGEGDIAPSKYNPKRNERLTGFYLWTIPEFERRLSRRKLHVTSPLWRSNTRKRAMAITAGAKVESTALRVRNSWWWGYGMPRPLCWIWHKTHWDAERERWLFAMLAVRQMSQDLG
jgi:hypothetical protein